MPRDWGAYSAGQTSEIDHFDSFLRELVESIPEPEQRMGRPRVPLRDAVFCAVKKVHSQLSSRRAQGHLRRAAEDGHLEREPHFVMSSRILNREDVTAVLHELVTLSALPLASIEEDFAIDSSGFRTTNFGAYCMGKYGETKSHVWLKAHVCVGIKTHAVARVVVTDGSGPGSGDTNHLEPLLRATADAGFSVRSVMADKAYSSKANHNAAHALGVQAFIPFRSNSRERRGNGVAWKKAYHFFNLHREEFDARYHKRSNVESVFSAIKRKFGETLKSKNRVAQENELLCKIIAYNITVLIQEMAHLQRDAHDSVGLPRAFLHKELVSSEDADV